ncbi:MAG: tRNA 2-thiouridine(34) synthase MnmA [Gammaproteobacteria bacterium]|nr:tRNA 2-thiouridine(34) synthase MnmA [Gammaproteobacteria bacterium]
MSGGVDSSIAAARLLEQGYDVTGLFMKNWEEDDTAEYCSASEDLADAESVCKQLGIELRTVNFSHEYWDRVFQMFLDEYRRGRTPNPDVVCNKEIKFKEFLKWALHLGADYIATGHYVRLEESDNGYLLKKGLDSNKDQSYFLHTLDQEALQYAKFPIGEMNKGAVREMAESMGLATHSKKDSTGICFIGERRFRDFLSQYLPAQPGEIQDLAGQVLGSHHGAYYYTIGQRQGLGIGGQAGGIEGPWYVVDKDVKSNVVVATQGHDHPALMKKVVVADDLYWVSGQPPTIPLKCKAKTRYRQKEQPCVITANDSDQTTVVFDEPQWAVTPGQSMVFYQEEICLGGGIIRATSN